MTFFKENRHFKIERVTLRRQMKWMGRRVVIPILTMCLFLTVNQPSSSAQNARSLTLLYSNNINGEIDPCPT
jgi:hypothetical protein